MQEVVKDYFIIVVTRTDSNFVVDLTKIVNSSNEIQGKRNAFIGL